MKRSLLLLTFALAAVLFSCKNGEEKTAAQEETPKLLENEYSMYSGEFIYLDDGAVLKGNNFIYGVALDEMAEELAKRVAPVKNEEFDMVPVVVKGILNKKAAGDEGWDEVLTIKEIVTVSDAPAEADIKIEEKKS
ncbi:hypothetical protein POV27_00970 [Aureisphaera galaxeae]|uniref:hypothetical protein n=1 Tax=Aureisphaera galaxeae TaxID=1538023 RepID=UPI002350F028|nr:hypothetical protein [Aureisphaera galaxeae]MDC8002609.1 hypothetical protein [Aureisphaera galaxeae]